MMKKTFDEHLTENARLVILRELAAQPDGRLNETLVHTVLEMFSHHRSREWVRSQLNKMEEIGAIRLHRIDRPEAEPLLIAQIRRAGIDHVERRSFLDGIERPSLGE